MNAEELRLLDERFDKEFGKGFDKEICRSNDLKDFIHSEIERAEKGVNDKWIKYDEETQQKIVKCCRECKPRIEGTRELADYILNKLNSGILADDCETTYKSDLLKNRIKPESIIAFREMNKYFYFACCRVWLRLKEHIEQALAEMENSK
jgi:hypothetical protein